VFGARLQITALRAPEGPGVEFLEYLSPRDGRPFPPDTRASDLWHWQINLQVADVDQAAQALRTGHGRFVSTGVTQLPDDALGFAEGLTAREPDGHALLLIEQTTVERSSTVPDTPPMQRHGGGTVWQSKGANWAPNCLYSAHREQLTY
jgi:hypothetical protein